MTSVKDLILRLILKDDMSHGLNQTASAADKASKKTGELKNTVGQLKTSYIAIAGAIYGAVQAFSKVLQGVIEDDRANQRLEIILGNVTHATEAQVLSLKRLADQLEETTTMESDAVKVGASQLATFQLTTDEIKKLLPAMSDLAVGTYGVRVNQDQMIQTANMLGKVLTGQIGALSRVGISFSSAQEEILKTGTQMERVATLADVVKQNFGGLATEMKTSLEGSLNEVRKSWDAMWDDLLSKQTGIIGKISQQLKYSIDEWRYILTGGDHFAEAFGVTVDEYREMGRVLIENGRLTEKELEEDIVQFTKFSEDYLSSGGKLGSVFGSFIKNYGLGQLFFSKDISYEAGVYANTIGGKLWELMNLRKRAFREIETQQAELDRRREESAERERIAIEEAKENLSGLLEIQKEVWTRFNEPWEKLRERGRNVIEEQKENYLAAASVFSGAFEGAFSQWISGAESLGKALEKSMINALASIMAKYMASQLFKLLLSVVGGPAGMIMQTVGGIATSSVPSFKASSVSPAPVPVSTASPVIIQNYNAGPFVSSGEEQGRELIRNIRKIESMTERTTL